MTRSLQVRFTTPQADAWLQKTRAARVLHVFENSCNLISTSGPVVSIVNPAAGCGPFNLVLQEPFRFSTHLDAHSDIFLQDGKLTVGGFTFDADVAERWDPRPAWQAVPAAAQQLLEEELVSRPEQPGIRPGKLPPPDDLIATRQFADALAGRGPGLTPSGDDFLTGWMHAAWCLLPAEKARRICDAAAEAAAPRTTSLSAAWLFASAAGLAGEPWHRLLESVSARDDQQVRRAAQKILATGHTSGADALSGFLAGLKPTGRTGRIPVQLNRKNRSGI